MRYFRVASRDVKALGRAWGQGGGLESSLQIGQPWQVGLFI